MTPHEKAIDLISKMLAKQEHSYEGANIGFREAIVCALVAVDEIIDVLENNAANSASWDYYEEVKQELLNIKM